jgi:hypothetical protein
LGHFREHLAAGHAEMEQALRDLGVEPEPAGREMAALFGHAVGLLVMVHRGRMRMFHVDGRELMGEYVARLAERIESSR